MKIDAHRNYKKRWSKLTKAQQASAETALRLFLIDPSNPQLRLHQLKGEWYPQFSISAGGDLRIHFAQIDDDQIVLMAVGTHAQLYK